jgi:hypothetical protein
VIKPSNGPSALDLEPINTVQSRNKAKYILSPKLLNWKILAIKSKLTEPLRVVVKLYKARPIPSYL